MTQEAGEPPADRTRQERAWYVIRVRGVLRPNWATWFPGFQVTHESGGDIVLAGDVMDRAAFYAVITQARDLGLAIISVERRDSSPPKEGEGK